MSSERKPSYILPMLQRFVNHNLVVKDGDSSLIRKAKDSMRNDLVKRYQRGKRKELSAETALDPRFKALSWLNEDEKERIYEDLKSVII